MNNESGIPPSGGRVQGVLPSQDADSSDPRRRRSSHHHHRHDAHKSKWSNEERTKKKLHLKVIAFVVPSVIVVIGGALWVVSHYNPEKSMRPQGLIKLSNWMLMSGGAFFILALLWDWARRVLKYMHGKREQSAANQLRGKKRSAHHRHRHRQSRE